MAHLDHFTVPCRNKTASAKLLAGLLGVSCSPATAGPFFAVYVNDGLTLDFDETPDPFVIRAALTRFIGLPVSQRSAVILKDVLGHSLEEFTTANLDFIQHYRPTQNVLKRPTLNGGQSIALTGHHEIMIPLLAAALKASV